MTTKQEQDAKLILVVNSDDTIKIVKNQTGMKRSELIKLLKQSRTPSTKELEEI